MRKFCSKSVGTSTSEINPNGLAEAVTAILPWWLSSEDKAALFAQLKQFPNVQDVYMLGGEPDYPMQGDVWADFEIWNHETKKFHPASGIILSNSCDISDENTRSPFQRVIFAPRYSLRRYEAALRAKGNDEQSILSTLRAIREQKSTRILYLPAHRDHEESLVHLDDVHTEDLSVFLDKQKKRVSAFRTSGWYLFLIKLSIHFTRVQENIQRG